MTTLEVMPAPAASVDTAREILDCLLMVADGAWAQKDFVAARRAYGLVLYLDSKNTHALNRMGRCQLVAKEPADAVDFFGRAFVAGAKDPATCINLAVAYSRMQDWTNALYWCAGALIEDPKFLPAVIQQAAIYDEMGQPEDALAIYSRAIELFPDEPAVKFGRSVVNLLEAHYAEGWREYEYRPDRMALLQTLDEYPEWRGQSLEGKTILVAQEQGRGDALMFARYIPLLQALQCKVIWYTFPELARLFALSFPAVQMATCDRDLENVEPDYWIALGSLPERFGAFQYSPVAPVQRFRRDTADVERFAALIPNTGKLRVGLCWQGQAQHRRDHLRSIPWEQMKAVTEGLARSCDFYSLQFGLDLSDLPSLALHCHDFADTAAAIENLDVVVTVDTAILHLAASLGKRTIGLLYQPFEWRWGREGLRTPWYPSLELIRQWDSGEWAPLLNRVNALLQSLQAAYRPAAVALVSLESPVTVSAECRYGRMTWPRNDHYIGRALDLYGEYSEAEMELLREVLQPGDTVLDIGANVGGLTLGIARAVETQGRVVAIEPQPLYFACLQENAPANVQPLWMAAGSVAERIKMRKVEERKIHAPGWESTGPEFEVQQQPIDHLSLASCALIKVDVDGPEHDILIGAEKTIKRCRPVLYVEWDKPDKYPDMLAWILARNYRLYQHFAPLYNPNNFRGSRCNVFGKIVSSMVLCIPNERKDLRFPRLARIRPEQVQ